jgi:hypothetical protein
MAGVTGHFSLTTTTNDDDDDNVALFSGASFSWPRVSLQDFHVNDTEEPIDDEIQ